MKRTLAERLVFNVETGVSPIDCWGYRGSLDKDGYGSISIGRKTLRAHRVSWEIFRGPIPKGLLVCHHCDHPWCTNPQHLFLGSALDNLRDCSRKKRRHNQKKTHCPQGHEYTRGNTGWWGGRRKCLECNRTRMRKKYESVA